MTDAINIPVAVAGVPNVSSGSLALYGPKRTFGLTGLPGSATVKIWGSPDGISFPPITATPLLTLGGEAAPKTIEDLSLAYRALPSAAGGTCTVDAQLDCCALDAGSFLNTTNINNRPAGGPIGLATATVDRFQAFLVDQTTPGQTLTLPAPTDPTATRRAYIENVGTAAFTMLGQLVLVGSVLQAIWNGSAWVAAQAGVHGTIGGVDAIEIGGGPNQIVEIDANGVVGGVQINGISGAPIQIATDSGVLSIDSAGGAIGIGTSAVAKNITIGNITGTTTVLVNAGAGGIGITATGAGGIQVTAGATGGVTLDSGTGAVNIGANATDHATTVGSVTGASLTTIQGGTSGVVVQPAATGPLTAKSGTTGAATFDSGTTGAVHVGDGANQKVVTVGSVTLASSLALRAGTGGLTIVNNTVTWTWPTALGAAGTKLTDAAGNGILSWT